jgi:4-aminobutyrate aminotransferase-like enzyme
MVGVEIRNADGSPASALAWRAVKDMLRRGFIVLPEGAHANVISFTPPLTISRADLAAAVRAFKEALL